MKALFLSAILVLISVFAEARVFDISKESFASYILAGGGPSGIGQKAFKNEMSGPSFSSDEVKMNWGGEFGFLYSTPYLSFRFGFEIIKPAAIGATASNAAGTALYDVKSDLTAYAPKVGLEFNFKPQTWYRGFVLVSAGASNLSMKNDYTLTAAGQAAFAGVSDHSVEAKSSATELAGGVGFEFLLSDSTTLLAEAGYRSLKFSELKYSKDVTTLTGNQTAGSVVLDADGGKRQIDFSGAVVNLGLRIYL